MTALFLVKCSHGVGLLIYCCWFCSCFITLLDSLRPQDLSDVKAQSKEADSTLQMD